MRDSKNGYFHHLFLKQLTLSDRKSTQKHAHHAYIRYKRQVIRYTKPSIIRLHVIRNSVDDNTLIMTFEYDRDRETGKVLASSLSPSLIHILTIFSRKITAEKSPFGTFHSTSNSILIIILYSFNCISL